VGLQAYHPAASFVTGDTDAAPQSATFHTANRYGLWAGILIFLPIFVEILLQNDHN